MIEYNAHMTNLKSYSSTTFATQLWATLLVALSGILYGFMGCLGTQIINTHMSISNMLFWRFLVAAIWIGGFSLIKPSELSLKSIDKRLFLKIFLLGAIFYSGGSAFYFLACQYTGTGLAMVIFFSYPIFIALFAIFIHKWKIDKYALFSLIGIVLGLLLIKGQGGNSVNMVGIVFAIISALSYAVYVFSSKKTTSSLPSTLVTLIVCLGCSFLFFLASIFTKSISIPQTQTAWFYILVLGIFATAVPIQLLLEGLRYLSPLKTSILSVLEPVVTLIVGAILLDESVSILQSIGIIIVLMSAILIQFERRAS